MADGLTSLSPLNWGQSTGGAAGSAENTLTLGVNRVDVRTPPDTYHSWHAQLAAMENLLLAISADFKGGTRLLVRKQTTNPFGAGESGLYVDTAGTGYVVNNGTRTAIGTGGGSTGNWTFTGNAADTSSPGTMTVGAASVSTVQVPELVVGPGALAGASYIKSSSATNLNLQAAAGQNIIFMPAGVNYFTAGAAYFAPSNDNQSMCGVTLSRFQSVSSYWYDCKMGAVLTAAATITPTAGIHHVTGATTINIIAATNVIGNARLVLIANSSITFGTSGSAGGIATAPAALVTGKAMEFIYDSATTFWYAMQGA